jgi:hypothetical protein
MARYEFLSETYLPTIAHVILQAKVHIKLAEDEGGARVSLCREFHAQLLKQQFEAMNEMTEIGHRLYPNPHGGAER